MAYQAQRHKRVVEDLELLNEDGTVAHVLHVDLDPDNMIVKSLPLRKCGLKY